MENKPTKTEPKLRSLIGGLIFIIVLWASNFLFLLLDNPGTYGDIFGVVNALFSGLAFALLIFTAKMQSEELALQREELAANREELKGQKEQLEQQNKTFELQRFEDSFFSLLKAQSDIVDAMKMNVERRSYESRACFSEWYNQLFDSHHRFGIYPDGKDLETTQRVYHEFYKNHQNKLGHYFRHLYHIIKFIDESTIKNKKRYTSLVRAQLSAHEHVLLFFNGLSEYGIKKFKPLIERYQLLENMPHDLLFLRVRQLALYSPDAYGDDVEKTV